MIDAVMGGTAGSWSLSSILANLGDPIDRAPSVGDGLPDLDAPGGAAQTFERALAEELLRDGNFVPFDADFELQNGALLSKAGEGQHATWRLDHADGAGSAAINADDDVSAAGPYRRVGFDGEAAPYRTRQDDREQVAKAPNADDGDVFRLTDVVAAYPTFRIDGSVLNADPVSEPIFAGQVLFNGDGRPILVPMIDDVGSEGRSPTETADDDGDLMILPDGAVLAYHPWQAAVGEGAYQ